MKRSSDTVEDLEESIRKHPSIVDDIMVKTEVEEIFISVANDDDDDGMVITDQIQSDHEDITTETIETEQMMSDVISEQHMTMADADESHLNEDDVVEFTLQPAPHFQNIVVQHMDIAEPLNMLRKLLESKLQCCLKNHNFYLQDQILLDPNKNLVEQCVQGEGMVQINAEIKSQPGFKAKINIVDILKQTEEIIEAPAASQAPAPAPIPPPSLPVSKVIIPISEESEHVTRWIVDQHFRKEQDRLKIPYDPVFWNETHVLHWIQWAIKEFQLEGVDLVEFATMTGRELHGLKHDRFMKLVPSDKGDIFWTHLELLRKCRFVAVVQQPTPQAVTTVTVSTSNANLHDGKLHRSWKPAKAKISSPRILGEDRPSPGNRSGNNGQIQLWQFLLELLTDKECREVIYWVGDEGEFKLNHPEMVAQMWGQRKNKPTMTYEKLSRALRYYYDGDMIAKVHGKRFVYKFVCDLKMLLGYSAGELNRLVTECAEKQLRKVRDAFRPGTILIRKPDLEGKL